MNKAALKLLVAEGFPKLFPHAHTFSEDTMVARIFRKYGVYPYDTKDMTGGERYMPFTPGHHYSYQKPPPESKDWYVKYSIDIKYGVDHCAARSVAFHYIKGDAQKRLHAILYHLCPKDGAAAPAQ
jgi:glycoprotein-N-acetylgalactosamine 3-beta-galactosyltransferase